VVAIKLSRSPCGGHLKRRAVDFSAAVASVVVVKHCSRQPFSILTLWKRGVVFKCSRRRYGCIQALWQSFKMAQGLTVMRSPIARTIPRLSSELLDFI